MFSTSDKDHILYMQHNKKRQFLVFTIFHFHTSHFVYFFNVKAVTSHHPYIPVSKLIHRVPEKNKPL